VTSVGRVSRELAKWTFDETAFPLFLPNDPARAIRFLRCLCTDRQPSNWVAPEHHWTTIIELG
jgi:hypothetical protein